MISLQNNNIQDYKSKIYKNEKLSNYSWFNLGGEADILFKPDNKEQLISFFRDLKKNKKKISIIGAGSNTLIRDKGVEGVTIKLSSKFSFLKILNNEIIEVGASTLEKKLSNFALENSISGFEYLSCIPGSIGGGIRMNSGCYGENISKSLVSITVMDFEGNIKELKRSNINFFYRGCNLDDDLIILSAKFQGKLSNKKDIEKKQLELIEKKKKSQPSKIKTCGSTFKNPENNKAWTLIKNSRCENLSVGSARISEKHCNFFINEGNATSNDIESLIEKVKKKVLDKTGVKLDLEIKIIGKE